MPRRGGRSGRRSGGHSGRTLFGRGFGGSRSTSGGDGFFETLVAFGLWMLFFYLAVSSRPSRTFRSDEAIATDQPVVVESETGTQQLEIIYDSWESYDKCDVGVLRMEGIVGYGNMSIERLDSTELTHNFRITANGYEQTFLTVSFLNNNPPQVDMVSVTPYILLQDESMYQVGQYEWEHPNWEYRYLIFRTNSGETGIFLFGPERMLFGVGAPDTRNFCSSATD